MRNIFAGMLAAIFLTLQSAAAYATSQDFKTSLAQQYVDKYLLEEVLDEVRADSRSDFNFTESEKIELGNAQQLWVYGKDFINNKDSNDIVKINEWYVTIYQDGKPVNVAGVYEKENGEMDYIGIGFGNDLAEILDKQLANGGKLIHEGPSDSWFILNNGVVTPANGAAKYMIGETDKITLNNFQKFVSERYNDGSEPIIEDGEYTGTGGFNTTPYKEMRANVQKSVPVSFYVYLASVAGVLGAAYWMIRKREIYH